jgi:putative acetyltransferase
VIERALRIAPGDLDDRRVLALLAVHAETARAATGCCSSHTLDPEDLRAPGVSLLTAWRGDELVGVGALKELDPTHGEIKSMHVARAQRGRGAGGALLRHIVAAARERGYARLSLETGAWDYFVPARALYARHGFVECGPFAAYPPDPNRIFLTLEL